MATNPAPPRPADATGLGWPVPPDGAFDGLALALPHAIVLLEATGTVVWANTAFARLTGYGAWDAAGRSLAGLLRLGAIDDTPSLDVGDALAGGRPLNATVSLHRKDGQVRWVDLDLQPLAAAIGTSAGHVAFLVDVTDRVQTATRLAQSERLATLGTLAAGVAHEIATPVQFIGDSVQFLREALTDFATVITALDTVRAAVSAGAPASEAADAAARAAEAADLEYLLEHAPRAVEACAEGVERVGTIVRSLKEFAHPQQGTMAQVDLNQLIGGTLTLARNEYKYVADLVTDFGVLPPVQCIPGSISQVVLNLVVNAAHAVADVVKSSGRKGTITVTTALDGTTAVITVRDTGAGIADDVRPHIFEPFFTTKPVGKGTGQGLALVHAVVSDTHGGSVDVASAPGDGATFCVRLPLNGRAAARPAEAA